MPSDVRSHPFAFSAAMRQEMSHDPVKHHEFSPSYFSIAYYLLIWDSAALSSKGKTLKSLKFSRNSRDTLASSSHAVKVHVTYIEEGDRSCRKLTSRRRSGWDKRSQRNKRNSLQNWASAKRFEIESSAASTTQELCISLALPAHRLV